jgi:hypothetical protein
MAIAVGIVTNNTLLIKTFDPESFSRYQTIHQGVDPSNNQMVNIGCHIWDGQFSASFVNKFDRCAKRYGKAIFITGGSHGMDLYNAVAKSTTIPSWRASHAGTVVHM